MRSTRSLAGLVLATTLLAPAGALAPATAAADAAEPARVSAAARAAAAEAGRARVVILFDVPALRDRSGPVRRGTRAMADRIGAARAELLARLDPATITVARSFAHVNAVAATVDAAALSRLETLPGVRRVDLDAAGGGHLAEAIPLARVDDAQALGLGGAGLTVAVIDSGYDSDHPDLQDDLAGEACFCSGGDGCCPVGGSTATGPGSAEDDHGHGTNVSGIVTGAGIVAAAGAAPDAGVVAVKVLDSSNAFSNVSDVISALDWVIQNRPDVDVVNMSLGTTALFAGDCDDATSWTMGLATAVATLRSMGVPVFASAGNEGSGSQMPAPACLADVIAVGAVWDADVGAATVLGCSETGTAPDQVTCFSNGNDRTDLFAPGAYTSASGLGGGVSVFAGTSQASPLAAGCAVLLLEDDPGLGPGALEALLEASPTTVVDATNGLGFPRLDCRHALDTAADVPLSPVAGALAALGLALVFSTRRGRSTRRRRSTRPGRAA